MIKLINIDNEIYEFIKADAKKLNISVKVHLKDLIEYYYRPKLQQKKRIEYYDTYHRRR